MSELEKNFKPEEWKKRMTNYQFNYLLELKDKVSSLEQRHDALYELVKTKVEAGASPEEILEAVTAFKENK